MNSDNKFNSVIHPDVWHCYPKIQFSTNRYKIQVEHIGYTIAKEYIATIHDHPLYELHYNLAGGGSVTIEDKKYNIKPGTFYIAGPKVLHSQISPKNNPTSEITLTVNIKKIKSNNASNKNLIFSDFDDILDIIINNKSFFGKDIFNAYTNLIKIYESLREENSTMNISRYWILIMQTLISTAQNIHDIPSTLTRNFMYGDRNADRLWILDDIFRRFYPGMSPEMAAKQLGLSVRQLDRITMQNYGMTFKKKYLETRMKMATSLLENLEYLTIDEISKKLDFSSRAYFSQLFKNYYGVLPSEYRKNIKRSRL